MKKIGTNYEDGHYSLYDPSKYTIAPGYTEEDLCYGEIPDWEWALYEAHCKVCRAWDERIAQLDGERYERLQKRKELKEEAIDTSDIPEQGPEFFKKAKLQEPKP